MNKNSKPAPNRAAPVRRYARLNKNFVVKGDLARTAKTYNLSGRDLYMLIELLAQAQRQDTSTLEFRSAYAILKLLGWQYRKSDYDALYGALEKWMELEISIDKFFVPHGAVDVETEILAQDSGYKQKQRSRGLYVPMSFKEILDIEEVDYAFQLSFSDEFCQVNERRNGHFVKAVPSIVKQLRYPLEIYLYLLLDAFDGSLRRKPKIIGLSFRSRPHFEQRLETALGRISETTDEVCKFHLDEAGSVVIYKGKFTDKIRHKLYGKSIYWGA
jgi:hypothetical protein